MRERENERKQERTLFDFDNRHSLSGNKLEKDRNYFCISQKCVTQSEE
jgi:hypothetical protein